MKKFYFLLLLLFSIHLSYSQTTVFSDDFDDLDISDWTLIDADNDGNNWTVVQIQDDNGNPVGTPLLRSFSWLNGALTPDNYAISPAIDLSGYTGTIELHWEVMAVDPDWDAENYTVYVATGTSVSEILASTVTFNESTLDGVNTLTPRTLDISSLAGQSNVYIVFRHHNVTDQFSIEIDNVEVIASPNQAVEQNNLSGFVHVYPTNASDKIFVNNHPDYPVSRILLYDLNGRKMNVLQTEINENATALHISHLKAGIYMLEIESGELKTVKKIIIQ